MIEAVGQMQGARQPSGGQQNRMELGADHFLKLLVTQLRFQDPLSGQQDSGEMISQLTMFSILEQMVKLQQAIEQQGTLGDRDRALALLNRNVEVANPEGGITSGEVSSVILNQREPILVINGQEYLFSSLLRVDGGLPEDG